MKSRASTVRVRRTTVVLPTYEPRPPDRHPMFLERRVYQGSSGRVYPLPFIDRIAERPTPRRWDVVFLENEFLEVMILPALGGRIHRLRDKTNGYDAIYHQRVIKPALVGLAGPWVSGGIEFNWPQHHRPSTFMPADVHVERHAGGAVTVWLSEHDPLARMKGMHGVRLHPGCSVLELAARVYNRTDDVQTFLWWANVATRVHERYQSFFPPDTTCVADHAKRAMSTFPRCAGVYYGVDYAARARQGVPAAERPRRFVPPHLRTAGARAPGRATGGNAPDYPPDDLSWYANIPVPTSYMCLGTQGNFFGGYDHAAQAGIVHVADPSIAPGKKQWTWGNHEFGYAWDRHLTDPDENGICWPYIELMAGVYTENQPDFSFLQPGETKAWSQFWYPFRQIGPVHAANERAAVSLQVAAGVARLGVAATEVLPRARIILTAHGRPVGDWRRTLAPDRPARMECPLPAGGRATELHVRVVDAAGTTVIEHAPPRVRRGALPAAASEPPAPRDIASADRLFFTGLHLEQYRHATRCADDYWREALRRDPGDARCNLALGRWHLRRGEFAAAERLLRAGLARETERNPNPGDGETHYQLGRCLRLRVMAECDPDAPDRAQLAEARACFAKAAWNEAWRGAAEHALAEMDCARHDWAPALGHVEQALRHNADHLRARNLRALILRKLGREREATAALRETLELDPLDWWARHLAGSRLSCGTQVRLDLAYDYARAGFHGQALDVLAGGARDLEPGTAPLVAYARAWLDRARGDARSAATHLAAAARLSPDWCFPARLEEIAILQHAIRHRPQDARAPFYLGNLLYDRRRHHEAVTQWERAVRLEPRNAVAWRNLGIAHFNVLRAPARARAAYERAWRAGAKDARLLHERDQLWKRLGVAPRRRLRELERHARLVRTRDDLTVEWCALLNQTGQPEKARAILAARRFQPWEGGEGQALGQHVRTHLALGRRALRARRVAEALVAFRLALSAPENLGEACHLLANQSDVHLWLGIAFAAAGAADVARRHWETAAAATGDFQEMSVREYSEMTFYSALARARLGRTRAAERLLRGVLGYARKLARRPARIDYFATSLPTLLLFEDDLAARQAMTARFLEAQARLGLGERAAARNLLRDVLRRDPAHAGARDLLDEIDDPRSVLLRA